MSRIATDDEEMAGAEKALDKQSLLYCERGVELLTDLLSQLPTRRFVHTLLEDKAVLIKCKLSALHSHPQGSTNPPLPKPVTMYSAI